MYSKPSMVLKSLKFSKDFKVSKSSKNRVGKNKKIPYPKEAGWGRAVGIYDKKRTIIPYRTGYLKTPIGMVPLL
jgi:hypothetical protein